jgi:tryptophanyl-tRNA synthetase
MDLQEPARKMSTTVGTEAGTIYVLDEPDQIRRKLGSAVTDSGREVVRAAEKPGISNLIDITAVARGVDPAEVEGEFAGAGYGDFKKSVAEAK